MDASRHAQIADALARGRLAPAEVAAIPPRELEALYETAARCLDAGRDALAADLLGGLVTLFPYSARYWRGYAIALHRRLEIDRARAAYEASLALDGEHELTRCYRAEILIYTGQLEEARSELQVLLSARDRAAAERARELLAELEALARWEAPDPEPEEPAPPEADVPRFELDDSRELPLSPTTYREVEEPTEPMVLREITRTARIFAPISDEPTEPLIRPEGTDTALLPRRAEPYPAASEGSTTALIPGRRGRTSGAPPQQPTGTTTALLPGRKGRTQPTKPDPADDAPTQTETLPIDTQPTDTLQTDTLSTDDLHTDMESNDPQTDDEPTHTDLFDAVEITVTAAVMRRDGCLTFEEND